MIFWIGVYGILLFCRVNFFWKRVFVRAISSCSTVVHIFNYFSIEICLNPEFFFIIKCHKDVRCCSLCCFSQQASQVTSPRHLLSSLSFDEKQTVTLTPFRNCIICSKKPENQSAIWYGISHCVDHSDWRTHHYHYYQNYVHKCHAEVWMLLKCHHCAFMSCSYRSVVMTSLWYLVCFVVRRKNSLYYRFSMSASIG